MPCIPCFSMALETSKWLCLCKQSRNGAKEQGLSSLFFFYSGFFGPDAIRPFDNAMVENDLKAKKFKTKDLELAVRQALNPSLLTQLEEENDEKEDQDEEEEEEEEEEQVNGKKGKSKNTSTAAANKKKPVANGKAAKKTASAVGTTTTAAQKRKSRKLATGGGGDEEDAVGDTAVGDSMDRKRRVSWLVIMGLWSGCLI